MSLINLNKHRETCFTVYKPKQQNIPLTPAAAALAQRLEKNLFLKKGINVFFILFRNQVPTVNRSTFKCPFCDKKNFDNKGLIKHCNTYHAKENQNKVR